MTNNDKRIEAMAIAIADALHKSSPTMDGRAQSVDAAIRWPNGIPTPYLNAAKAADAVAEPWMDIADALKAENELLHQQIRFRDGVIALVESEADNLVQRGHLKKIKETAAYLLRFVRREIITFTDGTEIKKVTLPQPPRSENNG